MVCDNLCDCSLCRQLDTDNLKINQINRDLDSNNFILKEHNDLIKPNKTKEKPIIKTHTNVQPGTIESKSNLVEKINNRIVIYFGDSINRNREITSDKHKFKESQQPHLEKVFNYIDADYLRNKSSICSPGPEILRHTEDAADSTQRVDPRPLQCSKSYLTDSLYNDSSLNESNVITHFNESFILSNENITGNEEKSNLPSFIDIIDHGIINIKIKDNYNTASKLVKKIEKNDCYQNVFDWSFVQEWRSRPSGVLRNDNDYSFNSQTLNPINMSPPTCLSAAISDEHFNNSPIASSGHIQSPAVVQETKFFNKMAHRCSDSQPINGSLVKNNGIAICDIARLSNNAYLHQAKTDITYFETDDPKSQQKQLELPMVPVKDRITTDFRPMTNIVVKDSEIPTKLKLSPNKTQARLQTTSPILPSRSHKTAKINLSYQNHIESENCSQTNMIHLAPHHHAATKDIFQVRNKNDCNSSSDENRSSGHASMSDNGHRSSSPSRGGELCNSTLGPLPEDRLTAGISNRNVRSKINAGHSRTRHRITPMKAPWNCGGLEDIQLAMQQLNHGSQGSASSTYSSLSAGSERSGRAKRPGRYSSVETINTNITNAEEFIWVDSHNRLVELQNLPWTNHCILRVIKTGCCKESANRISMEAIARIGYLLQRALVRISREIQRLSECLGLCSKHEVASAFKIVLSPALSDSCIKASLRAAAMFAVPGDSALRQSKSSRAGLQLPVGRFHRWMTDTRLGKFVHEYAAVYLCAGMENLLEEILLQCLAQDNVITLSHIALEHAIGNSGDLWGLLQPFAHLNAGRIASGELTMPRFTSQSLFVSNSDKFSKASNHLRASTLEACLLTTCVGSIQELHELIATVQYEGNNIALSHDGIKYLYYFMRCSQIEHNDDNNNNISSITQELCYERAYVVLPPLVEWLRVASAHSEYRHSLLIDKDDIMQAARLLLPGIDYPPRPLLCDDDLPCNNSGLFNSSIEDISQFSRRVCVNVAFKMMISGKIELLHQAAALLPTSTQFNTLNYQGLTALMLAAIRNDIFATQTLLDAGVDPNVKVPNVSNHKYRAHVETYGWTAITFAACRGNYQVVELLLENNAHVEGGAQMNEDACTITPLQVASGSGSLEIVELLLANGAHSFLSTQQKDSLCYSGSAQRGCFSSISVAASHGQQTILRKLLSHPLSPDNREILSLEEMLAESDPDPASLMCDVNDKIDDGNPPILNKIQIKSLQEAMYHSAENNYLDITVELRSLDVPWTLHCWMHTLAAAHELRLDTAIDHLLQDFLQVCPDDYSTQFVSECLPLLFNIFRYSKENEATTLLLADIFATCFGLEAIKPINEILDQPTSSSRIDPKFVNNAELSDVTFRVEGKIFFGHKIVLVTASPRFQAMLESKITETSSPTVQINDIRYNIFQILMQYLYNGDCKSLDVPSHEILELMAAASFFQLDGLLRYTEARCAEMITIDNVVVMYIHSKVYNALKLMKYCQAFLLQNMVAFITYDDAAKRLLFAKKIPNHDVLSGLLTTLQTRIRTRKVLRNSPNIKICTMTSHLSE